MAGENYRRVVPSFWTDPDLKRKLTLEQKALLLYFFTSPHSNMIGLYYCPLGYVSAETGLATDDIRRSLAGVLAPFVSYDDESEEVFVRRSAFHQMGELKGADKRKEGVRRLLEGVHSPRLKRAFLEQYVAWELGVDVPDSRDKGLDKGLSKGLSDGAEGATQAIAVAVTAAVLPAPRKPARKPKPEGPPLPEGYLEECCQLWETRRGKPSWGRIGVAHKHLVPDHGPRQVLLVWAGYLEDRRGKDFCAPEDFVTNYEHYRRKWGVEIGEDGTEIPVPDEPLAVGVA